MTQIQRGKPQPKKMEPQITQITQINEKLLRGVQGGSFLEKRPPGRRRQR